MDYNCGWPALNNDLTPRLRYTPHIPHLKQYSFLGLTAREALYGGAAGGGKSDALLMAALQFCDVPGYAAIIMRRSLSDLSLPGALIPRSHDWLDSTDASWDGANRQWRFPSGAKIQFGYVTGNPREDENALARYKSSEFQGIFMEESTEFAENEIRYMQSRLRRNRDGAKSPDGLTIGQVPLRMRYASNPGGPSHNYHKENFVHGDKAIFIQAFYTDNPFIDQAEYLKSLEQLSEIQQAYLLRGDWDQVEIPGALWSYKDINMTDEIPPLDWYDRKIICVDPAGSNTETSDETGIIVVGLKQGVGYVIEDLSGKYDVISVPEIVYSWAQEYGCSVIRVEKDYGADNSYVMNELRRISNNIAIDAIDSGGRGKDERANPIARLYRQQLIWHTKKFPKLEDQMQTWIPGVTKKSPDRIDAMVYAFNDLVNAGNIYSIGGLVERQDVSGQAVPGLAGLL